MPPLLPRRGGGRLCKTKKEEGKNERKVKTKSEEKREEKNLFLSPGY